MTKENNNLAPNDEMSARKTMSRERQIELMLGAERRRQYLVKNLEASVPFCVALKRMTVQVREKVSPNKVSATSISEQY
jgi:hypothetical protein